MHMIQDHRFPATGTSPPASAPGQTDRNRLGPASSRFATRDRQGVCKGFTLVEMLVVLGIVGLLAVLVVPALVTLLKGIQLTQGGNAIATQLDLARQLAVSKDQTIQVRLIVPSGSTSYSVMALLKPAVQVNGISSPPLAPVDKPTIMPTPIIVDAGSTLSSLAMPAAQATPAANDPPLGNLGNNYKYVAFSFYPDGSTSLATTKVWFLTVHNINDGDNLTTPPKNYYTIQIDPSSGRITQFTP